MASKLNKATVKKLEQALDHFRDSEYDKAIDIAKGLLEKDQEMPEALHVLGLCAYALHDQGRAIELIETAHRIDPDCIEYAQALAYIYTSLGQLSDGLYYEKLSDALEPHPQIYALTPGSMRGYVIAAEHAGPPAHLLRAERAYNTGNLEGAIGEWERHLRLNREKSEIDYHFPLSLHRTERFSRAVSSFHSLLHKEHPSELHRVWLSQSLLRLGRTQEALACLRESVVKGADDWRVLGAAGRLAKFLGPGMKGLLKDDLKKAVEAGLAPHREGGHESKADSEKIRIGIVSDIYGDPVKSATIDALIKFIDRRFCELYCYTSLPVPDSKSAAYKNVVSSWRELHDLDKEIMLEVVSRDQIDVLIDFCVTEDGNADDLFAQANVPLRLGWWNFTDADLCPHYTHILSDAVTKDVDSGCLLPHQKNIVLQFGLGCMSPLHAHLEVSETPALYNGCVTFGAACDLSLVTPETARVWSELLAAMPGTRIHFGLVGRQPANLRERVFEMFAHFGVAERVSFQDAPADGGPCKDWENLYVDFMGDIDIYLDSFPVSGTEHIPWALWLGVPVLSLRGGDRASLGGASILSAVGCSEWSCENMDSLIEVATSISEDASKLNEIRQGLRGKVQSSAFFNPKILISQFSQAMHSLAKGDS